jgi:hypothetical protein
MKLSELREVLRAEYLDDVAEPQLWSDDTLNRCINEACSEAAFRSRIIADSLTVELLAGQGEYPLAAGILDVTRTKIPNRLPLTRVSIQDLDESGEWESREGVPVGYVFTGKPYGGNGILVIHPMPTEPITAKLTVIRMPATVTSDSGVPELPEHLHLHLLDWAAYRAFSLRDSDANDTSRAAKHEMTFDARFGRRLSAIALPGRAQKRRHTTKINSDWS